MTAVADNLHLKVDKDQASLMLLMDLSAASNTMDHAILLRCLEAEKGARGSALDWFKSSSQTGLKGMLLETSCHPCRA